MPVERVNLTTRDAWLPERQHWVGASEVAVVCGEAGYGSLAELYAEKKGLRPPKDSAAMRRGRWGESAVFEALTDERREWQIKRAWVHVRCPDRRLACTPDGFAFRPDRDGVGVIQAKCISRWYFRQRWLDDPTDHIEGPATPPTSYVLQTLCEMMLNETSWGVLAVLVTGEYDWTLRLFDIERDPVLEDRIEYNAAAFLREYLDPGIMPPFEPQRDEALIKALYPKDDGTEIDLSGDNRALTLVEDWKHTQAALKRLKDDETKIKTELEGKLGPHTYGVLADGRRLSWRTHNRRGYVVEPKSYRVLKILNPKHEE